MFDTQITIIYGLIGIAIATIAIVMFSHKILQFASQIIGKLISFVLGATLVLMSPLMLIVSKTPIVRSLPFKTLAEKITAKLGALPFDRRQTAERFWPAHKYPELYVSAPTDIERPPFDDGRLVGGVSLPHLIDRFYSAGLIGNAIQIGLRAAAAALLAGAVIVIVATGGAGVHSFSGSASMKTAPLEDWGGGDVIEAPAPGVGASAGQAWRALTQSGAVLLPGAAATVAMSALLALFLPFAIVDAEVNQAGAPWRRPTKDSRTRFRLRAEVRNLARNVYRQQLELCAGYLAGSPTYHVGTATGVFRLRGDLQAPMPGQAVELDRESLHQHIIVFGGTGEGKTSAVLKPLARQILSKSKPRYGMIAMDAKAVLWKDLKRAAEQVGRGDDVVIVGSGADHYGIDPLSNLEPADLADTAKSLLEQSSKGGGKDDFWNSMAATIIKHAAVVAGELEKLSGERKYTLPLIYKIAINEEFQEKTIQSIIDLSKEKGLPPSSGLAHSLEYLLGPWKNLNTTTKTSVLANVIKLLDPLASSAALCERFGGSAASVSVSDALNGKILLFALSSLENGLAARFLLMLAKTGFYRAARLREIREGSTAAQSKPAIVLMDEAQEIISADTSGVSDGSFWNVARSAGVAGIIGTQTVAALVQAVGESATENLMQQFRSKIFLRTEDPATHEMCVALAGEQLRAMAYEDQQRESLEARALLDGFNPLGNPGDVDRVSNGLAARIENPVELAYSGIRLIIGTSEADKNVAQDYEVDKRFVGKSLLVPRDTLPAEQAAHWRQEDLERQYLADGNENQPVLRISDILGMGRWHAFTHIQRAGALRQDIVQITHEFD